MEIYHTLILSLILLLSYQSKILNPPYRPSIQGYPSKALLGIVPSSSTAITRSLR